MSGRSPARLLAPAALVATFLALFIVIGSGGGGGEEPAGDSGGNTPAATSTNSESEKTSTTPKKSGSSSSKRYTVKPGDTPSSIAEKAGIPLERLLELNPDIDPQALSPGQKLKLE